MAEFLDLSYVQGVVSQGALQGAKSQGIDRVIVRASRADSALAQDHSYGGTVTNARAVGLHVGHYHFNGHKGSIQQQASFFCDHIAYRGGDVLVLDVETEGGVTARYSAAEALAWIQVVKSRFPSADVWVYMSQSVTREDNWSAVAKLAKLWVASYTNSLGPISYWSGYVGWQYTSSALYAGIGRVDRSRYGSVSPSSPANPLPTPPLTPVAKDEDMTYVVRNTDNGAIFALSQGTVTYIPDGTQAQDTANIVSESDEIHNLSGKRLGYVFHSFGVTANATDPNWIIHNSNDGGNTWSQAGVNRDAILSAIAKVVK